EEAEGNAALVEPFDLPLLTKQERGRMASVHVGQRPRLRVVDSVEERNKPVAGRLPADLDVEPGDELSRLELFVVQRPPHRGERGAGWVFVRARQLRGGEGRRERGGASLSGAVADRHYETPVPERQDLVEVAADGVSRPAEACDVGPGRAEPPGRQHRLLNLT